MVVKYDLVHVNGEVFITGKCQKVVDALNIGVPMIWAHDETEVIFDNEPIRVFSVIEGTSKMVFIESGNSMYEVQVPRWPMAAPLTDVRLVEGTRFKARHTHCVETTYVLKRSDIVTGGSEAMDRFQIDENKSSYIDGCMTHQFAEAICAGKSVDDYVNGTRYSLGKTLYLVEMAMNNPYRRVVELLSDEDVCLRLYNQPGEVNGVHVILADDLSDEDEVKDINEIINKRTYINLIRLVRVPSDIEDKSVEIQQPEDVGNADQQSESTVMVNEPKPSNVTTEEYWIPQEGQYVLVVGERDVFVIKDYDVLDECFYLVSADSGRAHRDRQMSDIRGGGVSEINGRGSHLERAQKPGDPERLGYLKVHESYVSPFRLKVLR